jgi:hypothetical protein
VWRIGGEQNSEGVRVVESHFSQRTREMGHPATNRPASFVLVHRWAGPRLPHEAENMTIFQRWKQTALHNKALVISGVIVAFGTLFYAGAVIVQIRIAKRSAKATSDQIEKLITAANIQAYAATKNAEAAASFARSAEAISTQTKLSVDKFERMAKASEESIRTTQKTATDALQASIDSSRLDQRAWVGIEAVKSAVTNSTNRFGRPSAMIDDVQILIRNTGKTPALALGGHYIVLQCSWRAKSPDYDQAVAGRTQCFNANPPIVSTLTEGGTLLGPSENGFIVAPQGRKNFLLGSMSFGDRDVPELNNPFDKSPHQGIIYIVGEITYDDISRTKKRRTTFCLINVGDQPLSDCPGGGSSMD